MLKIRLLFLASLVFVVAACGNDGSDGVNGMDGLNGKDGASGLNGANGFNGRNAYVNLTKVDVTAQICTSLKGTLFSTGTDLNGNQILDAAEIASSAVICDGAKGADGTSVPAPQYSILQIVDPCGDAPGVQDEVLLKLANGAYLALFSDNTAGDNSRLSLLVAGSYMTTDGSHCYFTVASDGNITNEHN